MKAEDESLRIGPDHYSIRLTGKRDTSEFRILHPSSPLPNPLSRSTFLP
jgi:hypothetical protein